MNKFVGLGLSLGLLVVLGSCKPKQSAYQSVYQAAKEREMTENTQPVTTAPVTKEPAYPVYDSKNYDSEKVRQEKITAVYESDASGLRSYNVVMASLAVKPSADALKSKMENEGYKVILAQNEQGMYRVIIASYDDKPSAVEKRNEISRKYQSMGSTAYLKKTYGVPFDDLWILQRQY
ncbi:MAG: SPOR domain-containing protein [Dysgonomonas sp.]